MPPKGARLTICRLCRFAPASLRDLSGEVLERGRRAIECCRQMHSEASVMLQDNDALVTANQMIRRNLRNSRTRRAGLGQRAAFSQAR